MVEKELMAEAAILYYEKKLTQQEIADILYLSRQTVSKLLNEAVRQNIVEFKINHPKKKCEVLEKQLQSIFGIKKVVIGSCGSRHNSVRMMQTIKTAIDFLTPVFMDGNQNIATSWGRTIQTLVTEFHKLETNGNIIYPLFGATDNEHSYFSSNELARGLADKINATVKYAWFPYLPDNERDIDLFKNTSYYKNMCNLWNNIDVAIVGIGNAEIVDLFRQTFGYSDKSTVAIGDVATHFFASDGKIIDLYKNTLCASAENLKKAKTTVAIACGNDKTEVISGALKTKLIDVLITDEYTASEILPPINL